MFDHVNTPEEWYEFKLGAALKMENTIVEMLDDLVDAARDEALKSSLQHHRQETKAHADRLEQVFTAMGWEVDDSPCPAIEGIQKEGKANIKMADESIVDAVVLAGVLETEHHEIAAYEGLIIQAQAMGRGDVVDLLRQNLEQEQAALEKGRSALERMAARKGAHQQV